MAKPDTWMPFYPGDYLRDTMHLTTVQHGAYMLLIIAYWTRGGPLPDNDEEIGRICRIDTVAYANDMRSHHIQVLRKFFTLKDGLLHHTRIERELRNARDKSAAAKEAAEKRWGKSNNNANACHPHMPNACPSPPPSPSPSNIGGKPPITPRRIRVKTTSILPEGFTAFWNAYPRSRAIDRAKSLQAWARHGCEELAASVIVPHVEAWKTSGRWDDEQYCPQTTTYINQRRWESPPPEKGAQNAQPTPADARRAAARANEWHDPALDVV